MGLRVSQRQIFQSTIGNMNNTLSGLMESNLQASSQKKVNRPSDDPVGMARILSYRSEITALSFNQTNIKEAAGWLKMADSALSDASSGVSGIITTLKALANQSSTSTVSAENRKQIAVQVRELMGTLINLANSEYGGRKIFAGHKTDQPAYSLGLNVSTKDSNLDDTLYNVVSGATHLTTIVQFTSDGPLNTGSTFRYSIDGGKNWSIDGTVSGTGTSSDPFALTLPAAGGKVEMRSASGTVPYAPTVTSVDITNDKDSNNGTWMYIRPTAVYHGDTNDLPPVVRSYPSAGVSTAKASGFFERDIAVRIQEISGGTVTYSYSMNDGKDWIKASAPINATGETRLPVPGGFLDFPAGQPVVTTDINAQYMIHPERADIFFEVGPDESIRVNNIGKDIFGGIYSPSRRPEDFDPTFPIPAIKDKLPAGTDKYPAGEGEENNLFEVVGRFIAALETNSQEGCQTALEALNTSHNQILTAAANVGGRSERLSTIDYITSFRVDASKEGLSTIEDADLSELMTRLAQQQLAYNAVLKSSSMVMQMSLLNFV
ncbi:hypothetical protein [Desulfovibrio litoralis]|uniref:Flagellar hook-associated protein 3 FlgL n=1 Tax=Desulfovibrio litoralis DSM 11393 TaxID=1121455 RepID=A0A1M7TFF8_9BACT|nr:hypothetical protein [Desulfovibrio litoralis]SHN69437.1 flagellar hook-associated protein 3 FlgL [Desulfovibrio litoralis DSM 11393]